MTAPRPCLHVVPQLRWSREGDRSQPESDERLGPVLDDALRQLEEGRLPHLHLDGPLVLIEDWLAQAPAGERDQRRARIAQQVAAGRLAVGPWLVHTDPALASAELQEWNLRLGLELGDALGGAPRVGDLRHTSGPTAGVPSLLRRFGIHTAVLQRGIPAHHSGSWLRWSAPDGAEVTALWLPPVPEADAAVRFLGAERAPLDAELGARLTQLGATADMRCGSLAAFLATAPEPTTLPELRGELRDPRRVGTWPGTLSARIHLKQRHDACERLLFRQLAPLCEHEGFRSVTRARFTALVQALLRTASQTALGGCGVDLVHRAQEVRYDELVAVGTLLRDRALAACAGRAAALAPGSTADVAVFAPAACDVPFAVTCELGATVEGSIELADRPGRCEVLAATTVRTQPEFGTGVDARRCTLLVDAPLAAGVSVLSLAVRPGRRAPKVLTGRELVRTREHVLHCAGSGQDAPTLRWRRAQGFTLEHPAFPIPAQRVARFEDLADRGDLHDFAGLPGERPRIFDPAHLTPVRLVTGELFQELELAGVLRLPPGLTDDRTARVPRRLAMPVTVRAQIRRKEPLVRLTIQLTNTVRDHRLRLLLPFPGFARRVTAGMPWFAAERPAHTPTNARAAVHGDGQPATDTHPLHDWVEISDGSKGLAVFARGLREYAVVHDQNQEAIALTLVRAVGWRARDDLGRVQGSAGPQLPTPEGQCLRELTFELALFPHGGQTQEQVAAMARRFLEPPLCTQVGPATPG